MSGLLCAGDLYVDRLDDSGASTGLRKVGNAREFKIKENTEAKTRTSKGRETYGQVLDTVHLKQPSELTITLDEIEKDNLALALLADTEVINQTAGSVIDEVVIAKVGKFVALAKMNVLTAPAPVVTHTSGIPTYVAGTDYEINNRLGLFKASGAITEAQSLKIDYSWGAVTGSKVEGGAKPRIRARLVLDGKNLADGKPVIIEVDEASLAPTTDVDFLSDDFTPLTLAGQMKLLPGKDSPYSAKLLDA